MTINPIDPVKDKARDEAYAYFDQHIRPLPKGKDGKMDLLRAGFDDNDVDAFRHAYVSGVFTQEYGEQAANLLGLANEYSLEGQYSHSVSPRSRNMDLWNNRVGRKYGKKTTGRKQLLKLIHEAFKRGELILDLRDQREFTGMTEAPKRLSKPVISLSKSRTGRNETYYDLQKRYVMKRDEFVALIQAGEYRGYSVKLIRGVETPVSKHDGRKVNNIG
ncbi:MAG: hypothetical protein NDJ89_08810 [Oligoflexia bacterium]|nr:hypothetical protein [Oligoflexia bacterium]